MRNTFRSLDFKTALFLTVMILITILLALAMEAEGKAITQAYPEPYPFYPGVTLEPVNFSPLVMWGDVPYPIPPTQPLPTSAPTIEP